VIDGMPEGASVTLPVRTLEARLGDGGSGVEPDLTVGDAAEFFGRAPENVLSDRARACAAPCPVGLTSPRSGTGAP
jgi:hypothetical protein